MQIPNNPSQANEFRKVCAICGKNFSTKYVTKKFCSPECKRAGHRLVQQRTKVCVKCGATFVASCDKVKYCPVCAKIFQSELPPPEPKKTGKIKKICDWCGREFATNYAWTRFCSKKCSKKWHQSNDAHAHDIVDECMIPVEFFNCKWCGKQVAVYDTTTDKRTQFCSGICEREYFKRNSIKRERNTTNRGLSGGMSISSLKRREGMDLL